ncbi:hypothetical protein WDW89_10485 [Deltaproteobacteria bacterium TL4]
MWYSLRNSIWISIILLTLGVLAGCADGSSSQSDASACETAFNERKYAVALEKCKTRKDIAGAYLGLAGYDIINLIESTENSVSAKKDPTAGKLLGTDTTAGASVLNIFKIGEGQYANKADRVTAINTSQTYLGSAIDLLKDESADDLSEDEILIEIFATLFSTVLSYVDLLDVGIASASSTPILSEDFTDASGNPDPLKLILFNPAVHTLLACGTIDGVDDVVIEADGHVWAGEQNNAICQIFLNAANVTTIVNETIANGTLTINANRVSAAVCSSLSPMVRKFALFTAALAKLVVKVGSDSVSSSATISNSTGAINDLLATYGCSL